MVTDRPSSIVHRPSIDIIDLTPYKCFNEKVASKIRRERRCAGRVPCFPVEAKALVDDPDGHDAPGLRSTINLRLVYWPWTIHLFVVLVDNQSETSPSN